MRAKSHSRAPLASPLVPPTHTAQQKVLSGPLSVRVVGSLPPPWLVALGAPLDPRALLPSARSHRSLRRSIFGPLERTPTLFQPNLSVRCT
jgi:hypothetical protein